MKIILGVLFITCVVVVLGFIDFKIWRAEHPDAPTWTYYIRSER